MIEKHIIEWVKADEAAQNLRQAALWLRPRDPVKARLLEAKAQAAQAEAMERRESILRFRGDKPTRNEPD